MRYIKLSDDALGIILRGIDRAEDAADRLSAAEAHDKLPLCPEAERATYSLAAIVKMALCGEL